jgi:hypothetical protein
MTVAEVGMYMYLATLLRRSVFEYIFRNTFECDLYFRKTSPRVKFETEL